MKKFLVLVAVCGLFSVSNAQYPDFAYANGYNMIQGEKAMWQNIASMSNWWCGIRCKITDTCPQTFTSSRWGADSLACYCFSNYSGTNITLKILFDNKRTDTIPVVIPAGGACQKIPKIWKIVGSTATASTLDSLVSWWQFIKRKDF